MKNILMYSSLFFLTLFMLISCKDDDPSLKNEAWPKHGYLYTTDSYADTVYVESGSIVETLLYSADFPIDDNSKKWSISLSGFGDGVYIHNDQNQYWSIDSAFHPGLSVEQHFISTVTISNTSNFE